MQAPAGAAVLAQCGAHGRRAGRPCRNRAGFRTDHLGSGRCYLHGGRTPIRTGRYSTIQRPRLRELKEQHESDPNPLSLGQELALARGLLADYLERHPVESTEELRQAQGLVAQVAAIVERIERISAANAVSRPNLLRILSEMGRTVELYVLDEKARDQIKGAWNEIRL